MKSILSSLFVFLALSLTAQEAGESPFMNPSLSFEERVDNLVSRMTLQEKADQLLYNAPAIPRLGVPEYNWCERDQVFA